MTLSANPEIPCFAVAGICHDEVPARWFERAHGASRFQVVKWLPDYLRWYRYAFATSYLRRPAETVRRQSVT